MFTCYEGNKTCLASNFFPSILEEKGWNKASYDTLEEAARYMHDWLGFYSPGAEYFEKGLTYEAYGVIYKIVEE